MVAVNQTLEVEAGDQEFKVSLNLEAGAHLTCRKP